MRKPLPPTEHSAQSNLNSPADDSRLSLNTPLTLSRDTTRPREYRARLIRAGRIRYADNTPGPFTIPAEAIMAAVARGQFNAIPTFIDHTGLFENPSLRNLAGYVTEASWNDADQTAEGTIRLLENEPGQTVTTLFDQLLADRDAGRHMPDIGLSLVFWPRWRPRDNDAEPLELAEFRHIESVDFVFQPAADGRVIQALRAIQEGGRAAAATPDSNERTDPMSEETPDLAIPPPAIPSPDSDLPNPKSEIQNPKSQDWTQALQEAACEALIAASGLPAAAQAFLRAGRFGTPADLRAAIDAQRDLVAQLHADQVVQVGGTPPRGSHVSLGPTSVEQIGSAFEALLAGRNPPAGVAPLSGIRELYHLLSGDYELTGVFQPERVRFANVTTSTMAALVANALNKVVMITFQQYPQWWAPLVTQMDFASLQQIRWITLGGVGELPTVPEGGAYTELTWDDKTETADFVKKGGYLGITLETIDKDDTGKVRSAPRALAQAAWLTLSKAIAGIFTNNAALSDGYALFHAAQHGNLGSSALTWTAYVATRAAMMKQTELNSGERLSALTRPYYLIVPIDLEMTALTLLASEGRPGTGDNDINPLAEGDTHDALLSFARSRVVVCPIWTDATDWYAAAHPSLYPTIGLGFRYGRTPEIFSVASPTAGLMFSNDTLPVKVRFFYATGPIDYRGLYRHTVTG